MNRPSLDLRNLPLRSAVGGYARAEVEAFFERAAPDYEAARTRLDELRVEHGGLMALLAEAQEHERKVARVLSAAELASGKILERGRETGAQRIAAAERAAADLLRAAEADRARILAEIERIRYRQSRLVRVLEAEIAGLSIPDADTAIEAAAVDSPVERAVGESAPVPPVGPASTGGHGHADVPALSSPASDGARPVDASNLATPANLTAHVAGPTTAVVPSKERKQQAAEGGSLEFPVDPRESASDPWAPVLSSSEETVGTPMEPAEALTLAAVSRGPRRGMLVAAGIAALVIVSVAAIPWVGGSARASARQAMPARTPAPAVRTAPSTPAAAPGTKPSSPPAPAPAPAPSPDTLIVRLRATSDCWVRLTAGSYSEERLLTAGETLEHQSTSDVVVRTGNAGALVVTVNGRMMAPLGGEGEVVTRRITRPIPVS